jgi:uncharacterized protein
VPATAVPVTEVILKIASRCDLECDDCYMYELGDDTWKRQPRFMEPAISAAAADRWAQYARRQHLDHLHLLLHGGEALLAGTGRIAAIVGQFRAALPAGAEMQVSMQTNGTRLTEDVLVQLPAGMRIGISLDGDRDANDRHRVRPSGGSSYDDALAALAVLRRHRRQYGGILAVIDLRNDPVSTYQAIREQEPAVCDFLFPLATHDSPPSPRGSPGGYGPWLARVFDSWYLDADPRAPVIRKFRLIVQRLLGQDERSGFIGPPPLERSVVIQPDGSAELLDALRVTGNGRAQTGLNILTSSLGEIAAHPGYVQPEPCAQCRACPVFGVCGGGYYPERFSAVNGYDNPSVYCADMLFLINHIRGRLEELALPVVSSGS